MSQIVKTRLQPTATRRRTGILRKIFRHPPHRLALKILQRTTVSISNARQRKRDTNRCTYSEPKYEQRLSRYFHNLDLNLYQKAPTKIKAACENYLEHKFDLLGSGWVQVQHGMNCEGFRGGHYSESSRDAFDRNGDWLQRCISRKNFSVSRRLWNLLDDDYVPIDWQRDFKSGYRWNEITWHKDIPQGHLPGVDVKVPWELARMQHLPQMAVCFHMLKNDPTASAFSTRLQREFQNQIMDFMATNPPRFGVNWNCTMDVGIRVANWLLAWDLFQSGGAKFDEEFESNFAASVYDHAQHVFENLENTGEVVGNHYLANLAGLFFAAAYLPSDSETDRWLNFAWSELLKEIDRQFLADGANFEASTCYHCLSVEIVTWCVALHGAIDPSRFDTGHRPHFNNGKSKESALAQKLWKMRNFIEHTTKPNGNIHQAGDNDSGRFFKVNPEWKMEEENDAQNLQENHLDYSGVIAALDGLLNRDESSVESYLVSRLSSIVNDDVDLNFNDQTTEGVLRLSGSFALPDKLDDHDSYRRTCYSIDVEDRAILADLHAFAYRDFGLYIWKSSRCYIAIRCGPVGQNGVGGHAHCDQLAVEVNIDGVDFFADPGSYVYSADAEMRNAYRSVTAHNTAQLRNHREPSSLDEGLFRLNETFHAECHQFCKEGFLGSHRGFGKRIYRSLRFHSDKIEIIDFSPPELELMPMEEVLQRNTVPFSTGYGRLKSPTQKV